MQTAMPDIERKHGIPDPDREESALKGKARQIAAVATRNDERATRRPRSPARQRLLALPQRLAHGARVFWGKEAMANNTFVAGDLGRDCPHQR
jgi:hypothetical protein